nr:hypothetical protein [Ruminococcus bromii]
MADRKSDFALPTLDDLFSTQEERDEARLRRRQSISPFFSASQAAAPALSVLTVRSGLQPSLLYGNSAQAVVTLLRSSSAIPSLLTVSPQAITIRT